MGNKMVSPDELTKQELYDLLKAKHAHLFPAKKVFFFLTD